MRFYIMFGITAILSLLIIFFDPYKDYLAVYDDDVIIEYNYDDPDCIWVVSQDNENIHIENTSDQSWLLTINNKGTTKMVFKYINVLTNETKYTINYRFKNNGRKIFWEDGYSKGLLDFPDPR